MNINEIAKIWEVDKKQYVKRSTFSAYLLLIKNHISPIFGELTIITEDDVQKFVLEKLQQGLCQKTIKDILIVLKMLIKYGEKKQVFPHCVFDIIYPSENSKKELEVLSISNHKKLLQYLQENFTFKNLGIYICYQLA